MKTHYILIAVASLILAACSKTAEQPGPEEIQMTFRAYQEGATETKTTVQDGGTQVYWEPADEIKVFYKGTGGRFISQNTEDAVVANFSGTLNIIIGANEGASSTTKLLALYPYRADAASDGYSVTTTLPSKQTGRADSFAKSTHISLAATNANSVDLGFYNVTGGVRFSLTQEGIKSVTFEGKNGETLAGKIQMSFSNGVPVIQEVTEGETILTLNAPAGGSFETGKWYYIEALPCSLPGGFKMVFSKGAETASVSSSVSVTINRGKYGSIAKADEGLIFKGEGDEPGGGGEPDPSSVIQFADPIAKYACVEKFDTSGDGELSYAEAAAVSSLVGLFKDWDTVTRFDEIKFFTGVTSTDGVFDGLAKLESITIPDFITKLGSFKGCISLKSADLSSVLTSLPASCFYGCTTLTSVSLPFNLALIPDSCFGGCTELPALDIPTSVTSIGAGAFSDCNSLQIVALPSGLTSLSTGCFEGCTELMSITLPSGLVSIPYYCFQNCSALQSLTMPSSITRIDPYAFSGCSALQAIELPSGLKAIDYSAFQNCSSIISISFPASLTYIGDSAFSNCTSLTTITLGDGVSIGQYAFSSCAELSSITMGDSIKIGLSAFRYCSMLSTISLGNSIIISRNAFDSCRSLSSFSMGNDGSIVPAFYGCTSLTTVTLGNGVSVGESVFNDCVSLTSVVLPSDMTAIPNGLFSGCTELKTITWPSDLQSIGDRAFYGCIVSNDDSDASMIELPSTVKSIGSQAFFGVRHLIMPSTSAISIKTDSFSSGFTRLYVPAGMVEMYKVRTNWSNYKDQIIPISDYPAKIPSPVAEPVDLGLSVKWASWNVGASASEEYGFYFAWGEVDGKWNNYYDWSAYKWYSGSPDTITKYNNNSSYGTIDNKTVLGPEDDAAHVNWGGSWRLPTDAEWTELRENCTWTWTTQNGFNGQLVTSTKEGYTDKSIFLPAAGYREFTGLYIVGSYGHYWSSSLNMDDPHRAWSVSFNSDKVYTAKFNRYYGNSVRPVTQ